MRIISLFFLLFIATFSCYSQFVQPIICENRIVDKEEIKKEFREKGILSDKDSCDFVCVSGITLIPDTITNEIKYTITENDVLLYFPKLKPEFYRYNLQLKSILPGYKDDFYLPIIVAAFGKARCIYRLELFSNPDDDDSNQYQMIFFQKSDGTEYVTDGRMRFFQNVSEMLEYKFGSVENYIEAYKKRIAWRKKDEGKRRKFNEDLQMLYPVRGSVPVTEEMLEKFKKEKFERKNQ